ncbi:heterogeneous nuclear ribonucleoprotein U-like protein 2 isoform X2 [Sabethes cyaneus]|uniref:heterogeneous nuclear ribonucleoprotein U-like protein 2 isoform X2 n=1 Tax=Sabethes cyaneus TaxID=53552 RepID=UPI00237DEF98|nr:heterogeneous nuclear ribonucleoprotein U-like protein 2 isoform X2 [Sabethes cyaneus]
MDYNKLKVNDLKAELAARNLDTKGVKAVLVERLKEAIEKENNAAQSQPSFAGAVKKVEPGTPNPSTPARRSRRRSMTRSPSPTKAEISILESVSEEPDPTETTEILGARKKRRTRSITKSPSPVKTVETKPLDVLVEEPDVATKNSEVEIQAAETISSTKEQNETEYSQKYSTSTIETDTSPAKTLIASTVDAIDTKIATGEKETESDKQAAESQSVSTVGKKIDVTEQPESQVPVSDTDNANTELTEHENESQDPVSQEEEKVIKSQTPKRKSSSPGKDSPVKTPRPKPAQAPIVFVAEENEPELDDGKFALSWIDSDLNLEIDSKTFCAAKPLSDGALALVWASARANLGVTKGKVAFEVLLTKINETKKVTEEPITAELRIGWSTKKSSLQLGEDKHSFSYGSVGSKGTNGDFSDYGIEYKAGDVVGVYLDLESNPCTIQYTVNGIDQGIAFDFKYEELEGQALFPHICSKNIAFKVNFGQLESSLLNDRPKGGIADNKTNDAQSITKENQPESAELTKIKTSEQDPSIVTESDSAVTDAKQEHTENETSAQPSDVTSQNIQEANKSVSENTAINADNDQSSIIQCINPEFIYIGESVKDNLVLGEHRSEARKACEVIFLIGLPGSGKTHWINKFLEENIDKKFTILGVESLLEQMKVLGKPREPSNTNKWSRLIEQLSRSLHKLNDIAAKRRRNFIINQQTNVFASEQRRRLRGFGDYGARRAVIVVPSEEEYNRRLKLQTETGVEAMEGNVNAMKAHFHIPTTEQGWFTEITFAELNEEKTREEVKRLNDAGRKALPRNYNRNQQQRGRGTNQRWNQTHQGYGNNRYSGQQYQGGYNSQRYNNSQQYSQNRNYRPGNGYGRRDSNSGFSGSRYSGNTDWTRNSGRYNNRYSNQGYQNNQSRRYDGNRNDYRGYNSGWDQDTNCWGGYGSQGNDTQQWYSWWQSNVKNLLQQHGGSGTDSAQHVNMEQYWSQYAQQQNYGNYPQSKSHGSGSSSKNK